MSTVSYLYRIKRTSEMWQFLGDVRDWYQEGRTAQAIITQAVDAVVKDKKSFYDVTKDYEKTFENIEAETRLQFFFINNRWYFRVLESGYLFMNSWENWQNFIEPCFYDDRSDVDPKDKKNKKYAEAVDDLISSRLYLLFSCLDWEWVMDEIYLKLHNLRMERICPEPTVNTTTLNRTDTQEAENKLS